MQRSKDTRVCVPYDNAAGIAGCRLSRMIILIQRRATFAALHEDTIL